MRGIYNILLGALSKKRLALFMLTQIVGVVIIVVSIYLYVDVKKALSGISGESDYIIITKKISTLNTLMSSDIGFSKRDIKQLESQEGVASVGEFVSSNFRVLGGITVPQLNVAYRTDMFFEAVSDEFMDITPEGWHFAADNDTVPIIIPKNYVNLYNYGFAPTAGLPKLSNDIVKSALLDITISDRQGESKQLKGRVVGFSARINSILAPLSFVEWGNTNYSSKESGLPQRLIIKIDPAFSSSILNYLDTKRYEPENRVFDSEGINSIVSFVVSSTLIIGAIITLLSLALLLLTIYLIIERGKDKVFTLSTLGYSLGAIVKPYRVVSLRSVSISFLMAYVMAVVIRFLYVDILQERLELTIGGANHIVPLVVVIVIYAAVIITINTMIKREVKRVV